MFLSWSEDDQDKALAWLADEAAHCGTCRTRADEWDPARGGDRYAYVVEPRRCAGCEALGQARRELQRDNEHEDQLLGVHLALVPNTDREDQP